MEWRGGGDVEASKRNKRRGEGKEGRRGGQEEGKVTSLRASVVVLGLGLEQKSLALQDLSFVRLIIGLLAATVSLMS